MKRALIFTLIAVIFASSAWMFHRTEITVGRVLDSEGNGKLYNGEPYYNYIHYDTDRFSTNDIILNIDLMNPLNNYCDDVLIRTDFLLFKNV